MYVFRFVYIFLGLLLMGSCIQADTSCTQDGSLILFELDDEPPIEYFWNENNGVAGVYDSLAPGEEVFISDRLFANIRNWVYPEDMAGCGMGVECSQSPYRVFHMLRPEETWIIDRIVIRSIGELDPIKLPDDRNPSGFRDSVSLRGPATAPVLEGVAKAPQGRTWFSFRSSPDTLSTPESRRRLAERADTAIRNCLN